MEKHIYIYHTYILIILIILYKLYYIYYIILYYILYYIIYNHHIVPNRVDNVETMVRWLALNRYRKTMVFVSYFVFRWFQSRYPNLPRHLMGLTPTGWWLTCPSEKYESVGMMIIPNIWKIIQMFQTNNQLQFHQTKCFALLDLQVTRGSSSDLFQGGS